MAASALGLTLDETRRAPLLLPEITLDAWPTVQCRRPCLEAIVLPTILRIASQTPMSLTHGVVEF